MLHFRFYRANFALVQHAFAHQEKSEIGYRVAVSFRLSFVRRLVKLFIVGKRVRIGTRDVRVNQRGARVAHGNGSPPG